MTVPQRVLDTMNSGLIYTCDDEEMISTFNISVDCRHAENIS